MIKTVKFMFASKIFFQSPRALLEDHVTNDLESGTQDNWDNTNEPLSVTVSLTDVHS